MRRVGFRFPTIRASHPLDYLALCRDCCVKRIGDNCGACDAILQKSSGVAFRSLNDRERAPARAVALASVAHTSATRPLYPSGVLPGSIACLQNTGHAENAPATLTRKSFLGVAVRRVLISIGLQRYRGLREQVCNRDDGGERMTNPP